MAMEKEQAITTLAVYRERRGLRPDFVRGMFVPCAAGRGPDQNPRRRAKYRGYTDQTRPSTTSWHDLQWQKRKTKYRK